MTQLKEPYIDPQVYPSCMIAENLVERVARDDCQCGKIGWRHIHRGPNPAKYSSLLNSDSWGGREVLISWSGTCNACRALQSLITNRPNLRTYELDRGFSRDRLLALADACDAKATRMGGLESELIREVVAAHPGAWVTRLAFTDHPHYSTLDGVLATLDADASPSGSKFKLGKVMYEVATTSQSPVKMCELIDRHATGDHGVYGPAADVVSPEALWCPPVATVPEINRQAIDESSGVVRSQFLIDSNYRNQGQRLSIEIATFMDGPGDSTTYLLGLMS